jgi:2-C-methyl-D-erythritol 4-phosphate cytidylyltransferase
MIEWSLAAFRACDSVRAIVVAAPPDQVDDLAAAEPGAAELTFVAGGAVRAQSVANALAAVETELVAIHDAARPLLTPDLVEALVATLAADPDAAAVIPAAPVSDTVKLAARPNPAFVAQERAKGQLEVERTLDRSLLWGAQTPQVFRTEALLAALAVDAATRDAATDEAMLVEAAGGKVLIEPAPAENFKVTTPHDLRIAELLLGDRLSP